VTGHRPDPAKRPNPDIAAIRAIVADVLSVVRRAVDQVAESRVDLYLAPMEKGIARTRPNVRLVSALASGPDQWVAREAVNLGFELQCVLPFARDEYGQDFGGVPDRASEPEAEYLRLLGLASAIFEMDGRVVRSEQGERLPDGRSYQAAGRTILRQSDLLVALWDGQRAQGTGGTGEIVGEALGRGIPVIWVPWSRPETWRVLTPALRDRAGPCASESEPANLPRVIEGLLLPPDEADGDVRGTRERREYFREPLKQWNPLLGCWALFRGLVCGEFVRRGGWQDLAALRMFRVNPLRAVARCGVDAECDTGRSATGTPMSHPLDAGVRAFVDRAFLPHYAWANGLSIYFGHLHRSAFLVIAGLGAVAVFLALFCMGAGIEGRGQLPWILAELVVILGILGLTHLGRRRRWHQRWIDYRMLAERLRVARCTSPLGGGSPLVLHAGHQAAYGNPLRTWMHWHYQAIERAAGLPPRVAVTGEYLAGCRAFWLDGLVEDQRRYHEQTAAVFTTLDRRLHRVGNALFGLTLVACVLHIGHVRLEGGPLVAWLPHGVSGWLTLLCAFLPAAGAAFAAVRGFAETHRLAQRSRAMQDALAGLQADLADIPTDSGSLNLQRLRECADRVSDLMIRETLDWRVVFQDRPLSLPG